ncbi:MAG: iron-containing alcohol dehydrogenase [Clostridia bacterium]|nr:iron-containing alcohol dehydrogenase [Clostridia bacterium]
MDFNTYMPVRVITGENCVLENSERLAAFGASCLIITGRHSAKACGALADVTAALEKENIHYSLFDEIAPNPLLSSCYKAGKAAKEAGADFIIAIGGGSVLDAAKAAAIYAANDFFDMEDIYQNDYACKPLPLVVVGTTAGTGSEVSKVAVITNDATMQKQSINCDACYAALVLGDPQYTYDIPRDITVSTALDAFAHALEGWFSKKRNTMAEVFAIHCMRPIFDILRHLAAGEELTPTQRDQMYYCSLYAGMVLSVGTLYPHLLGYTLTDHRGVPHGQACAVFDMHLIEWNEKYAPELAQTFFKLVGADAAEVLTVMDKLIDIDENIRFNAQEIAIYSASWKDNNPKFTLVHGNFTGKDAVALFTKLFGE